MLYKPVFFGYIASAVMVVAALVLILIMHGQDRQYERRKLLAITGALVGSLAMNTLYFLSFFDQLTSLTSLYAPAERALDILCSFVINLCLFLYLYEAGRGGAGRNAQARRVQQAGEDVWDGRKNLGPVQECAALGLAGDSAKRERASYDSSEGQHQPSRIERTFWPALVVLTCGFGFAMVVYLTVVTEEYRVNPGNLALAETAQLVLTAVICGVSGLYGWLAVRAQGAGSADSHAGAGMDAGTKSATVAGATAGLRRRIAGLAAVNIATAIYNAVGSLMLFHDRYTYLRWSGAEDMNTWFFILSDGLLLLIVVWYYRQAAFRQAGAATHPSPNGDSSAAAGHADGAVDASAGTTWAAGITGAVEAAKVARTVGAAGASSNNNFDTAGRPDSTLDAQLAALGLTPRETEIALLILQRQTYREIAQQLIISEHTVKRHVHNIYEKAGVSRRDELIRKVQQMR